MYYGIDDNGNIVSSFESDVLPENLQSVFPDSAYDLPVYNGFFESVSSGDALIPNINYNVEYNTPEFDYDYLYDLLAAIPSYNIYPNATAVNVFTNVLNHLDGNYKYIITGGSTSGDTYLYYSKKADVSGNVLTLQAPVTQCRYYYYTSNSQTYYTYNISVLNQDETFTLSNRLIYTNLKDGYPDVIPYKQKVSFVFSFTSLVLVGVVVLCLLKKIGGRKHD